MPQPGAARGVSGNSANVTDGRMKKAGGLSYAHSDAVVCCVSVK